MNESYLYDETGQRLRKTNNGVSTFYPFAGYEQTGGAVTKHYSFGGRFVAVRSPSGSLSFLFQDQVSSTVYVTNADGSKQAARGYYDFGVTRYTEGVMPSEHHFTSQREDGTGLYYYGARYYDPDLGNFISPDTVVPDPTKLIDYNRYLYARGNPVKYNDPSGHDPLDTGWRNEFYGEHGYWPDATDEAIRLFSLAYPSEWDASKFYTDGGTGARIEGAQKTVFQFSVPEGRNWDTLGTALTSLAGWYLAGEEAMFIQDVEFLFAGSPSRTQAQADKVIYWATQPGYDGNLQVFIRAGTLDPKFYLNREGSPTDADMNVHHWAWGVAVGYNLGRVSGDLLNSGRELAAVDFDVNRVNVSDIYMGRAGVNTGDELWWNFNDISSIMYKYLEMNP